MRLFLPLGFLLLLSLLCFGSDFVADILALDPAASDLGNRYAPPSAKHLLGTDELGRDMLLRLLEGGRVSLTAGLLAALLAACIGTLLGMTAGFYGGWRDMILMRLSDLLMTLPALPLLIILSAIDLGKIGIADHADASGLYRIIILIALLGWIPVARLARGQAMAINAADFVLAARALGVSHLRILFRHILPNLLPTVTVATALSVAGIILTESALSFLGLGIQPPTASWGNLLTNAQENIWDHPRLTVYPGLMIFLTVFSFNVLADGISEKLDPRKSRAGKSASGR